MWKIKDIKAENVVSFKKLDLEFEQNVATLIFGQNNDSDGQNANGSGKSAIMEAISIALTGDSLRKVQTDEIISDWADDAYVGMRLFNDYDGSTFTIGRRLHRKGSQEVECHIYDSSGAEIMKEVTKQPTVPLYDKFILSVIGLERDELYNSYILCKNKYKSFLDASDKDKKELINRFTNGRIVDESIEALDVDIESAKDVVSKAELRVSKLNGSIEAIKEQIEDAERKMAEDEGRLEEKISECEGNIAKDRQEIREINDRIKSSDKRLDAIDRIGDELERLEKSDASVSECYATVRKWYGIYQLGELSDYEKRSSELSSRLDEAVRKSIEINDKYTRAGEAVSKIQKGCDKTMEEYNKELEDVKAETKRDNDDIAEIDKCIDEIDQELSDLKESIDNANMKADDCGKELAELANILHGAIECPKCKHKFIIRSEKTLEEVKDDYERMERHKEELLGKIASFQSEIEDREAEKEKFNREMAEISARQNRRSLSLSSLRQALDMARKNLSDAKMRVSSIKSDELLNQAEISKIKKQVQSLRQTLFDDVFGNIDRVIDNGEAAIAQDKERISFLEGAIGEYQDLINHLKEKPEDITVHLNDTLKKYKSELKVAKEDYDSVLSDYNTLVLQKEHFQMFKSHLANTKIDAISQMTNLFLQEIGSDIRVELEGFRLLKSGKMREKITVKILRDGEEVGSINKMSAGERTRIYLANILAMQKLSNGGCQDGKGLDFLALDEILEAVDYEGLMNSCDALNNLKVTSLVITQNSVQESYPNTIIVSKTNGISLIQ